MNLRQKVNELAKEYMGDWAVKEIHMPKISDYIPKASPSSVLATGLVMVILAMSVPKKAEATLVDIGFTAEIHNVYDDTGRDFFNGKINVGDIMTGNYFYDSELPKDSESSGKWWDSYSQSGPGCGIYLNINGFEFKSQEIILFITNNHGPEDMYQVQSHSMENELYGDVRFGFFLQLNDYTATALSSSDLPSTPPNLEDWGDFNSFSINYSIDCTNFGISGELTSTSLIPEPATIGILGLGALALLGRKRKYVESRVIEK